MIRVQNQFFILMDEHNRKALSALGHPGVQPAWS